MNGTGGQKKNERSVARWMVKYVYALSGVCDQQKKMTKMNEFDEGNYDEGWLLALLALTGRDCRHPSMTNAAAVAIHSFNYSAVYRNGQKNYEI